MLSQSAVKSLSTRLKSSHYSIDPIELITYEIDAGFDRGSADGIFFPESTEDVSQMMAWASETGTPLIARGGGTGLAGGAVPDQGGFVISFARMNRIDPIDTIGRSVTVEVGAVNLDVDAAVRACGLYFPPDPSSQRSSVIGGNMGTNAGGPHCFKYGVTTNYVMGIRAVMADGHIQCFGGRALDYPEYDFCALLVGSEGTLAVMTEADLRLIPNPSGVKTMMVAFDTIGEAGKAVSAVIAAGLVPATLEMMDQAAMQMITQFAPAGLPVEAGAVLIVEVDGHPESLDTQIEEAADLLDANGGFDIRIAQSEADRAQIWYGRKSAAGALARLSPRYYLTDVTVPRSHLGEVLPEIETICQRHQLKAINVFHAGDGNLHPLILCDEEDQELMERVHQAGKEIIALCVARNGSISGEHGIGMEKREAMYTMFSPNELRAMHEIKEIFDPGNLLNPGKVLPEMIPEAERAEPFMPTSRTFAPETAEEVGSALAALSLKGERVRISGCDPTDEQTGEEPSGQANAPASRPYQPGSNHSLAPIQAGYTLSSSRLNQVVHFAPDDLYIQVGAGMKVSDLQRFLHQHQVQTALMAPSLGATVGGVLAANVNSPQRSRYGSLRDNLLAATVVLPDGRVMQSGRPVVKNVAGYDLPKIFVGSYGSLGVLVDVTLKLTPSPRSSQSIRTIIESMEAGLRLSQQIAPHLLNCSGVVISEQAEATQNAYQIVCTVEGSAEEVAAEMTIIKEIIEQAGVGSPKELAFSTATSEWGAFMADINANSMIIRVGVPVAALPDYWQTISEGTGVNIDGKQSDEWHPFVDSLAGLLYIRTDPESPDAARDLLDQLRRPMATTGGYAVVVLQPDSMAPQLDLWGFMPESMNLMMALKACWDPAGILLPGGYLRQLV
ncbi:MAG: FAD-linked oxidase C-terminal domain-containing protein [Chloroflexota bacterium]